MNNKKTEKEYNKLLDFADSVGFGDEFTMNKPNDVVDNEEAIEKIIEAYQNGMSDDTKLAQEYGPEADVELTEEEKKLQTETVNSIINPINGLTFPIREKKERAVDRLDKIMDMSPEEIKTSIDVTTDQIQKSIDHIYPGIKASDIVELKKAIDRYRNGDNFSYFNSLPESMRTQIDMVIGTMLQGSERKTMRNKVTEQLFEQIIQDNFMNQTFIDMQESIDETFKDAFDDIKTEFSKDNINKRHIFEEKFPEIAILEEEKGNLEKAATLRTMSRNFIESYTYETMMDIYKNSNKLKAKKIELEKFNRTCVDFNMKYAKSKFIITDITTIIPVIFRHIQDEDDLYLEEEIMKFVIAFIKYTKSMSADEVTDHVFMYYFIKHILNLDYYDKQCDEEVLFYDNIIKSIQLFIHVIRAKEDSSCQQK